MSASAVGSNIIVSTCFLVVLLLVFAFVYGYRYTFRIFNQLLHVLLILMQNHRITGILLQLFCKISTTLTNMKCMDYKIMLISFQIRNEGIRSIVGAFHWPCFDRTNFGAGPIRQNSRQNPFGV